MTDWAAVRALFPVTAERTWLNTATYGPGPRAAAEAVERAVREWSAGAGDWRVWERAADAARAKLAALLEVPAANVALVPTVSLAAAQVAERLVPGARRGIVVGDAEFRSNLFPWLAQAERGFDVRLVRARGGAPRTADLVAAVDERTAVLAVSSVQSATGHRADLPALAAACRENGARLFVDGTQSVGALATPLAGVDWLAVSGYKWLFAPRGTAFLVCAPEHHGALPLAAGWKAPADPHRAYYGPPLELASDASRFDQSLAWPVWIGADAALDVLRAVGVDAIEAHGTALARAFADALPGLGLAPLFTGAEASQIVALEVPDPEAVARALADAGVVAAVRDRFLRVAFACFNDESDVERALAALRRAVR